MSSDHHVDNYERDPDNVYLWRHTPHRLDAEADSRFRAICYGDAQQQSLSMAPVWRSTKGTICESKLDLKQMAESQGQYRSVYLPIVAQLAESIDLFDAADPSLVTGVATDHVPAQSLYLMNSPFMIAQSRVLAKPLFGESGLK